MEESTEKYFCVWQVFLIPVSDITMQTPYERELHSWNSFASVMMYPDRKLFKQMLADSKEFTKAFRAKDQMPQEAFLMTIVLMQRKMMRELQDEIKKRKKKLGISDTTPAPPAVVKEQKGPLDDYFTNAPKGSQGLTDTIL